MKIAILESLNISREKLNQLKKPFEDKGCEFFEYDRTDNNNELKEQLHNIDVAILANMPLPKEAIENSNKLKFINISFTGYDHVDIDAAKHKNISISNASGYSTESVAELVIGMAISMYRNLPQVQQRLRNGLTKDGLVGNQIKDKTVGIIGLGKIGSRTAELFHAFGTNILSTSRTIHKEVPNYIKQVPLDELLQSSDIIVLHCPLNDETKNLINIDKLKLMKSSAILINVARGGVVNEKDLCHALKHKLIRGACLDVFNTEPPLDTKQDIIHAPNTLLTPHIAFATEESMELRAEIVFENLSCWIEGNQQNIIL